jgi:hypothetical protein
VPSGVVAALAASVPSGAEEPGGVVLCPVMLRVSRALHGADHRGNP